MVLHLPFVKPSQSLQIGHSIFADIDPTFSSIWKIPPLSGGGVSLKWSRPICSRSRRSPRATARAFRCRERIPARSPRGRANGRAIHVVRSRDYNESPNPPQITGRYRSAPQNDVSRRPLALRRIGLREFRNLKVWSVITREKLIGIVIFEALSVRVELERSPQSIGGVSQMAMRARKVGIVRAHRHLLRIA